MGLRILKAIEFLEPGYPEHLEAKVELLDPEGRPAAYPNSNCIIVDDTNQNEVIIDGVYE